MTREPTTTMLRLHLWLARTLAVAVQRRHRCQARTGGKPALAGYEHRGDT